MKHLIQSTNSRVWQAVIMCRVLGRNAETMGELRDSLNFRRNLRLKAHYSYWWFINEEKLRSDWQRFCARNPFQLSSGDDNKDFGDYCQREYRNAVG